MGRSHSTATHFRPLVLILGMILTIVVSGCTPGRYSAPNGSWRSNDSTLGSDLRAAPRGQTIPATALGVDLVGYAGSTSISPKR